MKRTNLRSVIILWAITFSNHCDLYAQSSHTAFSPDEVRRLIDTESRQRGSHRGDHVIVFALIKAIGSNRPQIAFIRELQIPNKDFPNQPFQLFDSKCNLAVEGSIRSQPSSAKVTGTVKVGGYVGTAGGVLSREKIVTHSSIYDVNFESALNATLKPNQLFSVTDATTTRKVNGIALKTHFTFIMWYKPSDG